MITRRVLIHLIFSSLSLTQNVWGRDVLVEIGQSKKYDSFSDYLERDAVIGFRIYLSPDQRIETEELVLDSVDLAPEFLDENGLLKMDNDKDVAQIPLEVSDQEGTFITVEAYNEAGPSPLSNVVFFELDGTKKSFGKIQKHPKPAKPSKPITASQAQELRSRFEGAQGISQDVLREFGSFVGGIASASDLNSFKAEFAEFKARIDLLGADQYLEMQGLNRQTLKYYRRLKRISNMLFKLEEFLSKSLEGSKKMSLEEFRSRTLDRAHKQIGAIETLILSALRDLGN